MLKKTIIGFDLLVYASLALAVGVVWDAIPEKPIDDTQLTVLFEELDAPIPAVKPKRFDTAAIVCMTDNIYHEARGESIEGQLAVFAVTMNRVREKRWGPTVCDVVYFPFAFSWTLEMPAVNDYPTWIEIRDRVKGWIKQYESPVGLANHYHTQDVSPIWSSAMDQVNVIGAHMFFQD